MSPRFRDRLAFRFLGIRYAPNPERFGYSEVYKGQAKNKTALAYSVECMRPNGKGSEDCLFINVWSPYLPAHGGAPKDNLKPVMFWIHGGAFTGGTHNDPVFDGSNISSRGDVILVAVNYRLGTLGFLALDDAVANGNYGLQDQITALEWVRRNIHNFGGDPDRITIFGQSAGAASVRALLASPKAKGKFAGAIMMSSLGGTNYGESYSKYYSITEEVGLIARPLLNAANCTNSSSQLDCLRSLPAATVAALTPAARFLVVDGVYLKGDGLRVNGSVPVENVPLMIGTMRDDGAAFIKWQGTENLTTAVITEEFPLSALASGLFPQPHSDNITLDVFNVTARISTDAMFRCVDQATAYAGVSNSLFPVVYYYEFNRSYQLTSYNPNPPVCNAPTTTENPNGDPAGEYFKCHSGELYYVFGNLLRQGVPLRDEYDLPFEQFTLDTWASFARTFNPNPDMEFLRARGYENTIAELHAAGEWKPVEKDKPTYRRLQWPSVQESCVELAQCENLGFSLNFLAH
jgi:carboxylesterase type B